jgi:hypothetical protein
VGYNNHGQPITSSCWGARGTTTGS